MLVETVQEWKMIDYMCVVRQGILFFWADSHRIKFTQRKMCRVVKQISVLCSFVWSVYFPDVTSMHILFTNHFVWSVIESYLHHTLASLCLLWLTFRCHYWSTFALNVFVCTAEQLELYQQHSVVSQETSLFSNKGLRPTERLLVWYWYTSNKWDTES